MYSRMKRKHWDIFSILIIPLFTILLASSDGWVVSNLSVIAYTKDKQIGFFVWGVLAAWYFNAYSWYLFRSVGYRGKVGISFLQAATISLIFAVTTPYLPEVLPLKAHFHIIFAFISPLLLLGSIICFQIFLEKEIGKDLFKRARYELIIIIFLSFTILFWLGFVSSLLEIFVTIGVCYYLRITNIRIEKYHISKHTSP